MRGKTVRAHRDRVDAVLDEKSSELGVITGRLAADSGLGARPVRLFEEHRDRVGERLVAFVEERLERRIIPA